MNNEKENLVTNETSSVQEPQDKYTYPKEHEFTLKNAAEQDLFLHSNAISSLSSLSHNNNPNYSPSIIDSLI